MPCDDCDHLIVVDPDNDTSLFCPRCNGLPVESNGVVQTKTTWLLEDHFTDENIIQLLENYSRSNLILYLLTRLNHISNVFFQENGIPVDEFGYLAYILKQVYETDGQFGDEQLQEPRELDEEIQLVQDAYTMVVSTFRDARNEFTICIKRDGFTGQMKNFISDYEFYQSEYGLCFERCVKSILCGDWDSFEDYTYVSDMLRSIDKTDVNDVDTVEEFADAWYQYILQLRLLASSDDMVGDTYYTQLPNDVTIFDIEEFLDQIDSQFTNEQQTMMQKEGWACALNPRKVDQCGRQTFGSSWDDVKDAIIISEDNLDAHPLLFEMEITEERQVEPLMCP